ncbi:glyoxylate/hydroxypyruvate reductase A [Robbsia sp. Bb-Pol-6]|uniref:Glyoxylate/hydroxypyruvate reductase A n=1 Tax=Robbsia betulipollinis TaxID=2981849 RepID=A0ABT3ZIN9_9BURK|nr:glyoxylate/hydroxypyruvate reductase A [Robbsia betulipollinis]MCY0386398.1 glyoxylate/hydroxypyruvate reductase A [Robbsia betulipollinis]
MVLLIKSGGAEAIPEWQSLLAELAPDLVVRGWDDPTVAPDRVRYALVWEPNAGRLAQFQNLELIVSSAAGVDHILADATVPRHVPIVRMVTGETGERMADFVTMAAYALSRDLPRIVAAQREQRWDASLTGRMASETTVGIMGLGELGRASATRLAASGFQVIGWARSPKSLDRVQCYVGRGEFDAFLSRSQILVNLLPDTDETRGIVDASLLARLPHGAAIVNAGRGSQLDPAALLAALDTGQVGSAMLDVFDVEPLPANHPLWRHPNVIVTPHVASAVSRRAKARQAAAAIAAHRAGMPVPHLYERERGY